MDNNTNLCYQILSQRVKNLNFVFDIWSLFDSNTCIRFNVAATRNGPKNRVTQALVQENLMFIGVRPQALENVLKFPDVKRLLVRAEKEQTDINFTSFQNKVLCIGHEWIK